jgi:hypothetical protein
METTTQENVSEVKRLTPLEWKEKWRQEAIEKHQKIEALEQQERDRVKAERKEFKERMHLELQKRIDSDYKNKYPVRYWIKQLFKKYFTF